MSATQLEQAAQATKTAFVFPGQGSQKAGMLAELAEQFSEILTEILMKEDNSEYFYSGYDECIVAIKVRGNEN